MLKKFSAILIASVFLISTVFCVSGEESGQEQTNFDFKESYTFSLNSDAGQYYLYLSYLIGDEGDAAVGLDVSIDGNVIADDLFIRRYWKNDGGVRTDNKGNEFAPKQIQTDICLEDYVYNSDNYDNSSLIVSLDNGQHTVTVNNFSDKVYIKDCRLVPAKSKAYEDYAEGFSEKTEYSGSPIYIQGEDAVYKSSKSIIPKADNSEAALIPSNPSKKVVNYIGSSAWSTPGDKIVWEFEAESDGLYRIGFKYRQNIVENSSSYRNLTVDGVQVFEESSKIRFEYSRKWKFYELSSNGEPVSIYLEKGRHTLEMTVTLAEIGESIKELSKLLDSVGSLYRKIVMITGETVDNARSYNLFEQIPQFNEQLENIYDGLTTVADNIESISGKGQSNVSTIRSLAVVIKTMLDNPYTAHEYKNSYYTQYCSLSSGLYEMMNMPLDIDYIALYSPSSKKPVNSAGIFSKAFFGVRKFLASFSSNYSYENKTDSKELKLWINTGRDQAQIIENLINTDFTVKTGIPVSVKLTDASVIQALLSGRGPDCVLNLARSEPINLAMRGALCDLSKFEDFSAVKKRFMDTACEPYEYQGGYYALPDTQSFSMMFYRKDILEELGCAVPKTWDEFLTTLALLQRNNLQAGIGSNDINMFATLLMQNGGSLYTTDKKSTNLDDETSIKTFVEWCGFFTDYKLPVTADYYNRFRVGLMPVIVTNYTMYITLKVAAPEIDGKWDMCQIPGAVQADGTVNNTQTSTGTGCSILENSSNKEKAWELLKWWTSADTQYTYSENVETILGVSGRIATANVEALQRMSWDGNSKSEIMEQWNKINDIPEIPGGYYVPRVITQAYWNVVSNGQDARDTLLKWSDIAKAEITRKRSQYNLDK